MKSFSSYVKIRESGIPEDDDGVESINPSDNGDDSVLFRLIRMAWKKHKSRTKNFFEKLATIDSEVASEFERIDKTSTDLSKNTERRPFGDIDVIRPPESDSSQGSQEDD